MALSDPEHQPVAVGRRLLLRAALAVPPAAALAACDSGRPGTEPTPSAEPSPTSRPSSTAPAPTEPAPTSGPPDPTLAGTIVEGLSVPWGIVFLADGTALVSERDEARIVHVTTSGAEPVRRVPDVTPGGEGGLLGLALHPGGQWLYAYLTSDDDNRVVRMAWDGSTLGDPEVVVDGIAANENHNGGALAFGPDGMLYVATGDAQDEEAPTDRESLNGKLLRITDTGEVPADNPFGNPVWSLGHRNVEGLAFDDQGRLWASEFGSQAFDELNLIVKGGDYGWPRVEGRGGPGREPLAQWRTDECSPAGTAIAAGRAWLGALQGECVWSVDLASGRSRRHVEGHGRLRMVAAAPDGSLWVGTSNKDGRGDPQRGDDKILRVTL